MNSVGIKRFAILALLMSSVLACGFFGFTFKKNVVASVDGDAITLDDLNDRIKTYPPQFSEQLKKRENKLKVLDQMVDEQILVVAAKKEGIHKTADYKKQVENAEKQLLLSTYIRNNIEKKAAITEEEAHQFYLKNPNQFQEIEQRRARHILVKTESEAKAVLKKIQSGVDFSVVAKQSSLDPSASQGGDLGWFTKGQLVPEFEKAVYGMKKGSLGIVKTQFGYHVVRLDDVNVRPKLDYEKVKGQIRDALLAEKKRVLMNTLLTKLKKDYKIKRDISKI